MTDRYGEVVQHYGYHTYGSERFRDNTSAFSVSSRYTGQTLDEDTGLYYYGARYYDPELARFIQADSTVPDPEFSQAYNRYAYVYNNPLKFTDPTGQNPAIIAAFIIKAIETAVVSAVISAGVAAAMGGNPAKAGIAGFVGGFAGIMVGGIFIGAMAGGALGALVTGGDPLQGAICAGIAVGVQMCLGFAPMPSAGHVSAGQYLQDLALSTASGALCGGVTAEIMGGDFAEGAASGAAGASANHVVGSYLAAHAEGDGSSVADRNNAGRVAMASLAEKLVVGVPVNLLSRAWGGLQLVFQTAIRVVTGKSAPWTQRYQNQNNAAIAAMEWINPLSMFLDREFAGLVDLNADGTYTPQKPVMGQAKSAVLPTPGPNTTAYYHTHGARNILYRTEVFSTYPGDLNAAHKATPGGIDAYLKTPGGKTWHYDVQTRVQTRLK